MRFARNKRVQIRIEEIKMSDADYEKSPMFPFPFGEKLAKGKLKRLLSSLGA